jgi:YhcH/YjgK/YiaL family protein
MLQFFREHDFLSFSDGEQDVVGRECYLRVFTYMPYPALERRFETHRQYADVHIILKGVEKIQTVNPAALRALTDYDAQKDIQFFSADQDVTDIVLAENEFAFFAPGEAHKPMVHHRELKEPVRKFVFKVRMGQ